MKISIFMIFQFFGAISAWATKALEDGKVSVAEGLELIVTLAGLLGVSPDFNILDYTEQLRIPEEIVEDKETISPDEGASSYVKPEE